jgi:P2 family phage contractile tail tube protein
MLPRILRNFNLFIDGRGYVGRCEEITLPKLTRATEDYRGAGMHAPVEMDLGMEKLECEFTLREFSPEVLHGWGLQDVAGLGIRFQGEVVSSDSTQASDSVEVSMRGRWRELDFDNVKSGEMASLKVVFAASYYKYATNGNVDIEIDPINYIEVVNGVDRLEQQRRALGI